MPYYAYTAIDAAGSSREGTVEAISLQAAHDTISQMGLQPARVYLTDRPPDPAPPIAEPASEPMGTSTTTEEKVYFPLLETLRLYAGWLLAWYSLVYAVGSYQHLKDVPWHIPYAESLFLSPMVLSFTFGAYVFLLCTSLYQFFGKKKGSGFVFTVVGITAFVLYRMNVS